MKYIFPFILLLIGSEALTKPYYFQRYSAVDGLSSVFISDIVQDSTGFIWVGTQDGLNRFDGYNFKTYKSNANDSNSLNDNLIRSLHVDKEGILWVGTRKGVARYDAYTDQFIRLPGLLYGGDNNTRIRVQKILSDKRNHIWIAMQENGIFRFDPITKEYIHYHSKAAPKFVINSDEITGMVYDQHDDELWITTWDEGLQRIQLPGGSVEDFPEVNSRLISDNAITNLFRTVENDTSFLLLHSFNNLFKIPYKQKPLNSYSQHQVIQSGYRNTFRDILQVGRDNIWMATSPLLQYNPATGAINSIEHTICELNSISNDNIKSLYYDSFGVLWVGTENGLNKLDTRRKEFTVYSETAEPNYRIPMGEVQAIHKDNHGTIWVGVRGNGLYLFRGNQRKNLRFENPEMPNFTGDNITSFHEDSLGRLWCGIMGGGLMLIPDPELVWSDDFKVDYFRSNRPGNQFLDTWSVRCIEQESENTFWIGTLTGIIHVEFKEEGNRWVVDNFLKYSHEPGNDSSLIGNLVNDFYLDDHNNLFIATSQGLSVLNNDKRKEGVFKNYFPDGHQGAISQNSIKKILEDDNGNLWFATQGGGLFRYDKEKNSFFNYSQDQGLTSSIIWGMQKDRDGNLWMSSNEGLWHFNLSEDKLRLYGSGDGLQNIEFTEFSNHSTGEGEMFFGGKNGFVRFYPHMIRDNPLKPGVVITGLRIFNQEVVPGDTIHGKVLTDTIITKKKQLTLTHRQNDFSFEFAGLHFASPEKNKYKYKLDGYDKDWKNANADNRIATYTNLPPGNYTFMVNASNNDNVWGDDHAAVTIKVLPPFWLTWWAYLIYLAIISAVFLSILHFARLRQKWQNELELDKLKLQFFTNISHEFRTPLTLILGPLEKLIRQDNENQSSLKLIQRNALHLQRLINQLLDIRRFEQGRKEVIFKPGNIVEFSKEITDLFLPIAAQKNYNLSFESDQKECIVNFDQEKLEKVLVNILSNAFKYTPEGGNISVRLRMLPENRIQISISDSGIGISKKDQSRIFERFYRVDEKRGEGFGIGLALSFELVKLHRGDIKVISSLGKGTCFDIIIPGDLPESDIIVEKEKVKDDQEQLIREPLNQLLDGDDELNEGTPLILVIDDNADMRLYIRDNLKEKYRVRLAENGQEGVRKAFELIPDLVISDVMMPDMDGFEVSRHLKNDTITSHIPVILLTGRHSAQSELSGLQTGADDYITKPFNIDILEVRIHNLLENRERAQRFFNQRQNNTNLDDLEMTGYDKTFMKQSYKLIDENIANDQFSVEEMATQMSLSRTQLYRKLKALTGNTPVKLIRIARMEKAAELLKNNGFSVSETAYETGFKDIAHFSRAFREYFGKSPSDFLKSR